MNVPDGGDLWRLTVQHSPIGMTVVDLDGRLILVNRALSEMLGRSPEVLTQHGFQELTHPDDLASDLALFHSALAGEIDSYRVRKRYFHADGHVVWGDLSVAVVRHPDGTPRHFISQILDVTEQKTHAEQLEAVFEAVGVGLLLIGPDGQYLRMNRRHAETMHLPFPEGHQGTAGQLGHVYHADGKTPMTREDMPSYRAMKGEEFDDYHYWVGSDPATRLAFSTSARMVRGPSGERLGAALAYQEITELMRAMQVKDEFVASISHELRTPLTSVMGYLELLMENQSFAEDVREQLRVVQRNAGRLQSLVSDLLEVGQLDEAGLSLQRADVDMARLVREAAEAARRARDRAGVETTIDAPDSLVAHVDEKRMRQVLDNLLSNAVKYSPQGGAVRLTLCRTSESLVIDVSDTGMGIAEEDLPHVFDRFFRGTGALAQHLPGTGLGLNIVGTIVAAHHGSISVDSTLGTGTTFRVSLPLAG